METTPVVMQEMNTADGLFKLYLIILEDSGRLHVKTRLSSSPPTKPVVKHRVEFTQKEGYDAVLGSVVSIDVHDNMPKDQLFDVIRKQRARIEQLERERTILIQKLQECNPAIIAELNLV